MNCRPRDLYGMTKPDPRLCYACDHPATGGVFRLGGGSYRFAVKGSRLVAACPRHAAHGRRPGPRRIDESVRPAHR